MMDIKEFEMGILIEASDFDVGIHHLINDIIFKNKGMNRENAFKLASSLISSMLSRDLITLVKRNYVKESDDIYSPTSQMDLSDDELNLIINEPEKWEEMNVFSKTECFEISITTEGRRYLDL